MKTINAAITAVGGYVPPHIVDNATIVQHCPTSDQWIKDNLGVAERRILKGDDKGTSSICAPIALEICRKRGITPADIDMLLIATSTPDKITPSTSNIVAGMIGANNVWAVDVNLACSGFLGALDIACRYIEQGRYANVMVIGADKMSAFVDYTDRATGPIFADGGGGVLLEQASANVGIIDSIFHTEGVGDKFLHVQAGGSVKPAGIHTVSNKEHFLYMNGKAILQHAVPRLTSVITDILHKNNLTAADIDWFVPHQASKRIVDNVAAALQFPRHKILVNINRYGNTSAGTIPLCLWDYEQQFRKGDKLLLCAFGAGFTWGAMLLTWGDTAATCERA